ncbi:MAG: hypothetical protein ABI763_05760 [Bacteroidota bacterium]
MLKENIPAELAAYISRMDEREQSSLLKQLQLRDTLFKVRMLDKKQKAYNKGTTKLDDAEIASIVRSIRKAK